MKEKKKYFNPTEEELKAADEFMEALESGLIEKDTLPNSSLSFQAEAAAVSISNVIKSGSYQEILNK